MKNWKAYLLASAAVGCCAAAEPANAQLVFGGGATFPAPVYRQLMDCHSVQVDGNPSGPTWPTSFLAAYPISPKCANAGGDSSGLNMQILYSPVGSGAGKRALIAYDASSAATGLGVPSASNNVPFVSSFQPTYGYPNLQFIGSDDIWNETDAANYAAGPAKAIGGNAIQMPALAGAVVIAFNGKDGAGTTLNIANAVPAGATADKTTFGYPGAYSGLNLTRKAVCGIFTGHITAWNDPELTKANNNTVLGTGQITVEHRSDGSGTNFLFTNALYRQCQGISGPINTTDALSATPSVRSWEFRFSDHANTACPDVFFRASNTIDWPDFTGTATNGCGVTLTPPSGSKFVGANGNGGMKSAIESTNGAIGYSTTDYSQPVLSTGMKVANVQSQYDVDNATGAFQWPSPTRILNTMAAANPIFPDANARANPLNWSSQGQVPNPGTPNSYPIAGFTWIDMYQCYNASRSGGGTLSNFENYLGFHYYDSHAAAIINSAGFATIPNAWRDQIAPMLTGGPSQLGTAGDPSVPGCTSKSGA
ncbi:substrate-binding domain-containing protein [Bradyrhizobium rifense]|nr:substrate-binding domain-containing protein [Bradyrhizobium rifense]